MTITVVEAFRTPKEELQEPAQLPKLPGLFPLELQGSAVPCNKQLYPKGLPFESMIIIDLHIQDNSFMACEEGVLVSSSHKHTIWVGGGAAPHLLYLL